MIVRRKVLCAFSLPGMFVVWISSVASAAGGVIPASSMSALIAASGAVTVAAMLRFARLGYLVRRDLEHDGIHVKEPLFARTPEDVRQWAARNEVDLAELARVGDRLRA